MDRSTIVALLVVVGLGGLAWWYFSRGSGASTQSTGQSTGSACGPGIMGSIGQFIEGHVDRKNAVAPTVVGTYAHVNVGSVTPVVNLASKLSPSSYLENKVAKPVGEWLCKVSLPSLGSIANKVVNTGKESAAFGVSQLKAGTVGPIGSLASAGNNLVHGNFGDTARDVYHSIADGPKAAYNATKDFVTSIF